MKRVYMVLGAIGSGKSRVLHNILQSEELRGAVLISSDAYKEKFYNIPVSKPNNGYRAADELMMKAFELAAKDDKVEKIIVEFCPLRQNKIKTLLSIIEAFQLSLVVLFVHTDNDGINKERVKSRNKNSDNVSEDKVAQSYSHIFQNVCPFLEVAEKTYLIDNSGLKDESPCVVGVIKKNLVSICDRRCKWVSKICKNLVDG